MRSTALLTAAVALAMTSGTAFAAWKEYPYKDLGFVVEFPDSPTASMGNYHTEHVDSARIHSYKLKEPDAFYAANVVDLQDRATEAADLLIEAEFNLSLLGDVRANGVSRVEIGKNGVFGQFITIDCRSQMPAYRGQTAAAQEWFRAISGMDCPNNARLTVNLLFNRGRLYLFEGLNLPNPDGRTALSPSASRFANSVSLFRADGTRYREDGGG